MRASAFILLALVGTLALGCGGGGSSVSPSGQDSGSIRGPKTVPEGSSAQYSIERTAEATTGYQWSLNPPSYGTLSATNSSSTTLNAGSVPKDTPVELRVAITPSNNTTTVSKISITIKDMGDSTQTQVGTPVAAAEAEPMTINPGGSVRFTDRSVDPDGVADIVRRQWDFTFEPSRGFVADSEGREPCVQYPNLGQYFVQLRVTDSKGLWDMLDEPIEIEVTDGTLKPVAKATAYPNPGTVCAQIQFQNDGSYARAGGSITKYEWDWENDGIYEAQGSYVEHAWQQCGTYEVQFRVTDSLGQTGKLASPIIVIVRNASPVASASASDYNPRVGQFITLDASNSYDPDCNGSIVEYEWDLENDGLYDASGRTVDVYFDYAGIYPVMLRVTDDEGDSSELVEPLTITVDPGRTLTWGGGGEDHGYAVGVDDFGNIYVAGTFSSTVDFDPEYGIEERTSSTSSTAFLSKFDSSGAFQWVTTWGDSKYNIGYDIAISGPGYIYVAGTTSLVKVNPNGDILWSYDNGKIAEGVAVDDYAGVYLTGHYVPNGQSDDDAFLSNLGHDGSLGWEVIWGGSGNDLAFSVVADSGGGPVVVGQFTGTVDFDPGTNTESRTAVDSTDSFISKFSSDGGLLWVKSYQASSAFDVATDSSDALYVTGFYEGQTDFDPGPGFVTCTGTIGSYVAKYDKTGAFVWVQGWTGWAPPPPPPGCGDPGYSVACDSSGLVYVAGMFEGDVDFDPTGGNDIQYDGGAYLAKYTSDGHYEEVLTWGSHYGTTWDSAWSVAVDGFGNAFVAGDFEGQVDFAVDVQEMHDSNGEYDAFLVSLPYDLDW